MAQLQPNITNLLELGIKLGTSRKMCFLSPPLLSSLSYSLGAGCTRREATRMKTCHCQKDLVRNLDSIYNLLFQLQLSVTFREGPKSTKNNTKPFGEQRRPHRLTEALSFLSLSKLNSVRSVLRPSMPKVLNRDNAGVQNVDNMR